MLLLRPPPKQPDNLLCLNGTYYTYANWLETPMYEYEALLRDGLGMFFPTTIPYVYGTLETTYRQLWEPGSFPSGIPVKGNLVVNGRVPDWICMAIADLEEILTYMEDGDVLIASE